MGLSHIGHHPIRSGGGSLQLRAELLLLRRMPALSMARPLVVECLLTNELLSKSQTARRKGLLVSLYVYCKRSIRVQSATFNVDDSNVLPKLLNLEL
jgi:hypothetical protein